MNLYVLGLVFVMLGAVLMTWLDSLAPMAAGTASWLMLSLPLLKCLKLRYFGPGQEHPGL